MKKNTSIILFVILFIFNFITMKQLISIDRTLSNIKIELSGISTKMNFLDREIRSIKEGEKWISSVNFTEIDEESSDVIAVLNVEVIFRELEKEETPIISIKNIDNREVTDISLKKKSGLIYSCNINLDRSSKYEYTIYSSGEKLRSGDKAGIPYDIYGLPEFGMSYGSGAKWFSLDIHFNNIPQYDGLKPEKVTLYIRDNNQNLKTYKLENKEVEAKNRKEIPEEELLRYWYIRVNKEEFDFKVEYRAFVKVIYRNGLEKETDITHVYRDIISRSL